MLYIDIHTHKKHSGKSLEVISIGLEEQLNQDGRDLYSLGVHPWKIQRDKYSVYTDLLSGLLQDPRIIMIGETGLDKLGKIPADIQTDVFKIHVGLSEKWKKPLIIHCVRCFNEIILLKKTLHPQMPWIIHGFNNKLETAEQLLQHGMYLSFGKALFDENSTASQVLCRINPERFFLETDDSDFEIKAVYQKVSRHLKMSVAELCEIQQTNFKQILEQSYFTLCIQGQNYSLEKKD